MRWTVFPFSFINRWRNAASIPEPEAPYSATEEYISRLMNMPLGQVAKIYRAGRPWPVGMDDFDRLARQEADALNCSLDEARQIMLKRLQWQKANAESGGTPMDGAAFLTWQQHRICDFCNTRPVTSLYPTKPFCLTTDREIFPDAPISIDDGLPCVNPDELHPVRGTAEYFDAGWTACEACATLIDTQDHEGLVQRCYNLNYAASSTDPEVFALHQLLFLAFFKHREGPRLPHPALS